MSEQDLTRDSEEDSDSNSSSESLQVPIPDSPVTDPSKNESPVANTLPYASEAFGVYQPLIGWYSNLASEKLANALSNRVRVASNILANQISSSEDEPVQVPRRRIAADRTGTQLGAAIVRRFESAKSNDTADLVKLLSAKNSKQLFDSTRNIVRKKSSLARPRLDNTEESAEETSEGSSASTLTPQMRQEAAMASLLHHFSIKAPHVVAELFRAPMSQFDRVTASATLLTDPSPSKNAFLSPIGILHMFRQYFFQLGTFLGPPVGHVWISPGGSVELMEVNTRRVLVERTTEQSSETITKTELQQTDKDELADAVKAENANDTKLGATVTASGGVGSVFQASGSASFNMDSSRKEAQEQTHKRMREQSSKLSTEVRQNFKTTFRTVTETTDTSSRRYVLQNTTPRLVSYELSRKMRKVAVQVQDLGQRLCWQIYVDGPGSSLGLAEFVHATGEALEPSKGPDQEPLPQTIRKAFSSSIPFVQSHGGGNDTENTYVRSENNPDLGIHKPLSGDDNIILLKHDIPAPPPDEGYRLNAATAFDFKGAQVQYDPKITVDAVKGTFTIHLTSANFNKQRLMAFDCVVLYEPLPEKIEKIKQRNAAAEQKYTDEVASSKEKQFYDTFRAKLKLISQVQPRSQTALREEERNIVYRSIISTLYGKEDEWNGEDYHVAAEMIRYFFDIDAMLYFVAPDWWKPRAKPLASPGEGSIPAAVMMGPLMMQSTSAIVDQAVNIGSIGADGRAHYRITEETTPARHGASLGWLMQIDGDDHRNAFLNSPWVKAVLPIRPGREAEAIKFLQRDEVAGVDGLEELYPFDSTANDPPDPPDWEGKTIMYVLLQVAKRIKEEYDMSKKPIKVDKKGINDRTALPSEIVFERGYSPLEGGTSFDKGAFEPFSEWTEVLPTDQIVATEYSLQGNPSSVTS